MEFDETLRFWCPRVALVAWINFAFSPDENLRSNFCRSEKEAKRRKIKNKISLARSSHLRPLIRFDFYAFYFIILLLLLLLLLLFWIFDSYCFIRIRFYPEKFYFFSVQFILNELNPSHFLTSKIFVKISSLKSLTIYHPKNRKIFRLSQNLTKLFWVTRFNKTNLTAQYVSSSEI